MPYTYLHPEAYTQPTGSKAIDESLADLRAATGWDYRVGAFWCSRWFRKPLQVFTIFVPVSGDEFGLESFTRGIRLEAPEEVALAFLEALRWGALDERQRNADSKIERRRS